MENRASLFSFHKNCVKSDCSDSSYPSSWNKSAFIHRRNVSRCDVPFSLYLFYSDGSDKDRYSIFHTLLLYRQKKNVLFVLLSHFKVTPQMESTKIDS